MSQKEQGKGSRQPLGQILKGMGAVSEGDIQEALAVQRKDGGLIGEILVALDVIDESRLAAALGVQSGMEFFDFEGRVEKRTGHYHGGARQD